MSGVAGGPRTWLSTCFTNVSDGAWLVIVQLAATSHRPGSSPGGATAKVWPFQVPSALVSVAVAGVAFRFGSSTSGLK